MDKRCRERCRVGSKRPPLGDRDIIYSADVSDYQLVKAMHEVSFMLIRGIAAVVDVVVVIQRYDMAGYLSEVSEMATTIDDLSLPILLPTHLPSRGPSAPCYPPRTLPPTHCLSSQQTG